MLAHVLPTNQTDQSSQTWRAKTARHSSNLNTQHQINNIKLDFQVPFSDPN